MLERTHDVRCREVRDPTNAREHKQQQKCICTHARMIRTYALMGIEEGLTGRDHGLETDGVNELL